LNQHKQSDPIVAIATAPGKGGVGVVRFSFPQESSFLAFTQIFCGKKLTNRVAHLLKLSDEKGYPIDEGLALPFTAPASYTGEYVLEFQGHGGQAVLQNVLAHALQIGRHLNIGLRHAIAGEFTQRAFLNDKLDLAQAEAVADLIEAGSSGSAKAAAMSLSGVFSKQVNELSDAIIHLRLLLEATLDFPEEEIDFLDKANAKGQLDSILNTHKNLLRQAQEGVRFRDGVQIALVGEPNVGKSSLLNALAGEEVAIVSAVAGTTRDRIKQALNIRGVPLIVIDTAGLRETTDEIELIGIERTQLSIAEADLVLHMVDVLSETVNISPEVKKRLPENLPVLHVLNKIDLLDDYSNAHSELLPVSVKTGEGLELLKDEIFKMIGLSSQSDHHFMARQRHVDALHLCGDHINQAVKCAQQGDKVLDLFAEELRLAHDALGEITGRMLPDDLLGLIFSRFCIGK
jgi:tRNA modification GTPase